MKKGDIVKVHDSSYSLTIVDGLLEHHPGEVQKEPQLIVAVGCDLPADWGCCVDQYQRNNTIVRGQVSGRIIFVQQRFCHPIASEHKVMIDITNFGVGIRGNIIEIPDKLYKEIKRDSRSK